MSHHRALVVAVWVLFTIAGPVAASPAATDRGPGDAPDATGTVDTTANLQSLIDATPDGGVVQLEAEGNYRVDGTLLVADRHDLRIEGNGARIFAGTVGDYSRSHLRIVGGSDLTVRHLEIDGANPHAGLDDRAYRADLEGQHGIRLEGATDVELDGVKVQDVFGDFVYVGRHGDGRWTERTWIHDSTFTRNGRQGISVTAGRDVVIERNTITETRRATIDLEPNTPSWGAQGIYILDNTVGPGRLLFVAAAGQGPVGTVVVARNALQGHMLNMWVEPPPSDRRQGFWVVANTSDTPATQPPLRFLQVDGAIVTGNLQPVTRAGAALVESVDSCGVSVSDNSTEPGTIAVSGDGRVCDFALPAAPPEPPAVAGRGRARPAATTTTETAPTTTTTEAASTTTETAPTTTTETAPTPTAMAARDTPDGGVDAGWIVAVVVVLAAGVGAAVAVTARRARR